MARKSKIKKAKIDRNAANANLGRTSVGSKVLAFFVTSTRGLVTLGAAFTIFVAIGVFAYNFASDEIFIDDVEIEGIPERTFNGSSLLEGSLALMPKIASRRLSELPALKSRPFEMIEIRSADHQASRSCVTNFSLGQTEYEYVLRGLKRGVMSSTTPDSIVSDKSFTLRKLAFFLRERLGWNVRQIRPRLTQVGGKYTLTLRTSPYVTPQTRSFDKIEEADTVLADMLVNLHSPEIEVMEKLGSNRDFKNAVEISNQFLRETQKSYLVLFLYMSAELEGSRTYSDLVNNYLNYAATNEELLSKIDFSLYGDVGPFLRAAIAMRVITAERHRQHYTGAAPLEAGELFKKYLMPLEHNITRTVIGQVFFSFLEAELGQVTWQTRANALLSKELLIETDGAISNAGYTLLIVSTLMRRGLQSEASNLLFDTSVDGRLVSAHSKDKQALAVMRSLSKALNGDFSSWQDILKATPETEPCLLLMAVASLQDGAYRPTLLSRPDIVREMLKSYETMEKAGLANHSFYNQWGMLETDAGNHARAIEKFDSALRFEGDHSWALLNAGRAAYLNNDFSTARNKYIKSLEFGIVPAAVYGYLHALIKLEEFESYIDVYSKYFGALRSYDTHTRSYLEAMALIASCELKKPSPPTILRDGEQIMGSKRNYTRADIDLSTCAFPD